MKLSLKDMIVCGIFAAVLAVLSQISIVLPFSPIPFTMQTFGLFLIGAILGCKRGFISVMVYILLGAIGIPVFASYSGGPAVLFGKTGGFIIAFPFMALIIGYATEKYRKPAYVMIAMFLALVLCYAMGTIQFSLILNMSLAKSMAFTVIPYVPLDLVKVVMAALISVQVRRRVALGAI